MDEVRRLEACDLHVTQLRQLLPQSRPQTLRLDEHTRQLPDFLGGLRLITKIRDEQRLALSHKQQCARSRESAEIANVGRASHEQSVQMCG